MKKLFTLLLASFVTMTTFAQCIPDLTDTIPGLTPASADIPCIAQGVFYDQDIKIYVPSSAVGGTITITSVAIDSIRNLPCGIKYAFNKLDETYIGGERGCMRVYGTTSDPVGQYRLVIYVNVNSSIFVGRSNAALLPVIGSSFNIYLRVKGTGLCATLDTMPNPATAPTNISSCRFVTPDATVIPNIANDITAFSVSPIPTADQLNVSFTADAAKDYDLSITNMVGAAVYSDVVKATRGTNNLSIDLANYSNGIYYLNIKKDGEVLTKKIIVAH